MVGKKRNFYIKKEGCYVDEEKRDKRVAFSHNCSK